MPIRHTSDLMNQVLESFRNSKSKRYRQIMQSATRHLHEFVEEVHLTEEEWQKGIEYLTRTGRICTDKRQEFILLSDALGVSMQVININNPSDEVTTESTVFGPFFTEGSPQYENGDNICNGGSGEPCFVRGTVLDGSHKPIPHAHLAIWESDSHGLYDSQYSNLDHMQNRGQLDADANGRFWFWCVKPTAYPIPYDGPVGDMLKAANRSPMRPPHLHFMITAPKYRRLITHVFVSDASNPHDDAVFGVKQSLIADFRRQEPGVAPDGTQVDHPYYTLEYDFTLKQSDSMTAGSS